MILGACLAWPIHAQDTTPSKGRHKVMVLPADVQGLQSFSWILGRPTGQSIVLNMVSEQAGEVFVAYGAAAGSSQNKTTVTPLRARQAQELLITGLAPDTAYQFEVFTRAQPSGSFTSRGKGHFHTQRAPGAPFTFEIQGDSHPERRHQFDSELYAITLRAAAQDRPDFYFTMGDDFSVDTLDTLTPESVSERYWLQRPFLAIVGRSAPIFMVNGNHEQASRSNLDGTPNNVAVWAQTTRNRLFSLPAPDHFYSGDEEDVPHIGQLRDYYAWTWGDALFVVIDPYWHSPNAVDNPLQSREKKNKRDLWQATIGDVQYQWLKKTLTQSPARFKFVFTHHILGTGRGGVEWAPYYEWGGKNRRGQDEFARYRPQWDRPLHQLMVDTGVTIVFQGHDHVFAHQELDGVTYQTVPEPADPRYEMYFSDIYTQGKVLPNSGRVRISVSAQSCRVEYLRSYLPKDENYSTESAPAYAYFVAPRAPRLQR